jgi:hypothetical protein
VLRIAQKTIQKLRMKRVLILLQSLHYRRVFVVASSQDPLDGCAARCTCRSWEAAGRSAAQQHLAVYATSDERLMQLARYLRASQQVRLSGGRPLCRIGHMDPTWQPYIGHLDPIFGRPPGHLGARPPGHILSVRLSVHPL